MAAPCSASAKVRGAFQALDVDRTANAREIKEAYTRAVKQYHPDSGSPHANTDKFTEVYSYVPNSETLGFWYTSMPSKKRQQDYFAPLEDS